MHKVSETRHTNVRRGPLTSGEIETIEDFVGVLQSALVDRVALQSSTNYRKNVIGTGAQFTVYDDTGIGRWGTSNRLPPVVVKCARFQLSGGSATRGSEKTTVQDTRNRRKLARSLYQELVTLTHPSLQQHPNITRLLRYDLVPDEHGQIVVPALIMERATYGNLHDFLHQVFPSLDAQYKVDLCADATAGLAALHQAGIIHGDVKADNILIFHATDPSGRRKYVAKLSDFGSAIFLDEARQPNRQVRYHGTSLTNAPETLEQFGKNAIPADMLVRCDNYSLGLVYLQVLAGDLDVLWTSKNAEVLENAVNFVQRCPDLSDDLIVPICRALELLLPYNATDRCADLAVVLNIFRSFELSDIAEICPEDEPSIGRSEKEVSKSIERNFGSSSALNFGWGEEEEMPKATQIEIIKIIQAQTRETGAGRAHFLMALAYSRGFGVEANVDLALKSVLEAARKGYLPAQAIFHVWHSAHARAVDVDEETQLDWLYNACLWGSVYAAPVLRQKCPSDYQAARQEFHTRGGYNQYFYNPQAPAHIKSEEFLGSLKSKAYQPDTEHMAALLQSAAIYGDITLAQYILKSGNVDLNLCSRFGESLLVLCCKGGHMDLLHFLVNAGANANVQDMITGLPSAESPLHWIVAFDDDDQKHATSLLMRAGAEVAADISWNHPLIDLPGKLPLGTPFHYATFFNNPSLLQELLHQSGEEHSARFANITGSSELTPLEYAARYHRYEIIQRLLENRACHDSGDSNTDALVLHEISNLATYESWTIDGLLNLRPNEAAGLCTMVLLDWDASLLEQEDEIGATPLMTACYNHNRAVVKCLIERGCNVNARTPFEYDGRTALNLYSNNQLAYADDDILDLLYAENADLELGSASGMKPLHYAARDNNMRFAKRLLELGVQLDARTHRGLTPLHCAASYGATDVGQLLMDSKADLYAQSETGAPHEKNGSGLTPLAMAISQNQKEFIDLLLNDRYNLDPIAKPTSADTIIHFAITAHQPDILRRVLMFSKLKDKALLNRKNLKGVTALHLAAGSISRQEHIKLLIKAGADVNIVSCTGHTTLDIAHQTRELVRARINHGTDAAPDRADTSLLGMQCDGDEEEDHQNPHMELEDQEDIINSLERGGAKRAVSTPIPQTLLSLD